MIMSLDSKKSIRLSHEVARNVLKTSQANAKRDYDMLYKRAYKVGDLVYVLDTSKGERTVQEVKNRLGKDLESSCRRSHQYSIK